MLRYSSPRSSVFATKANPTTRENISNVFGAKSVQQLVPLELDMELVPSSKLALRSGECVYPFEVVSSF